VAEPAASHTSWIEVPERRALEDTMPQNAPLKMSSIQSHSSSKIMQSRLILFHLWAINWI